MTWTHPAVRYRVPSDDAKLDQLIEVRAEPVLLGRGTADADADRFEEAAKKIFLPDAQIRSILRRILEVGQVHAELHFPSEAAYKRGLQLAKKNPWGAQFSHAICLVGHAGVGKTQLLAALERLVGGESVFDVDGIQNLPQRSLWLLTVRDGSGLNDLLANHVDRPDSEGTSSSGEDAMVVAEPKAPKGLQLKQAARKRAWRDTACLIVADEFQFISQSSEANAKATALLLNLHSLGPRIVYCSNFSMAHKLWKRSKEDKDRLLAEHLTFEPWSGPCEGLIAYLNELKKLAPEVFVFDAAEAQGVILDYTFGIRRNIVVLLKLAYISSRGKSRTGTVDLNELRDAYLSVEYSVFREDVTILTRQAVQGAMLRVDLWNPWNDKTRSGPSIRAEEGDSSPQPLPKVVAASAAINSFEARVNDALIKASLTSEEREALKDLAPTPLGMAVKAKVIRLGRGSASKEKLLAGADALDALK